MSNELPLVREFIRALEQHNQDAVSDILNNQLTAKLYKRLKSAVTTKAVMTCNPCYRGQHAICEFPNQPNPRGGLMCPCDCNEGD